MILNTTRWEFKRSFLRAVGYWTINHRTWEKKKYTETFLRKKFPKIVEDFLRRDFTNTTRDISENNFWGIDITRIKGMWV